MPTFNLAGKWYRLPLTLLEWLVRGTGPAAAGTTLAQIQWKTSEQLSDPDIQLLLSLVRFSLNPGGEGLELAKDDGISNACSLLTPRSRRRVRITFSDPLAPPLIEHQLLGDEVDLDRLEDAARRPPRGRDPAICADEGSDFKHRIPGCGRRAAAGMARIYLCRIVPGGPSMRHLTDGCE